MKFTLDVEFKRVVYPWLRKLLPCQDRGALSSFVWISGGVSALVLQPK